MTTRGFRLRVCLRFRLWFRLWCRLRFRLRCRPADRQPPVIACRVADYGGFKNLASIREAVGN
jgi:hypothetical protein